MRSSQFMESSENQTSMSFSAEAGATGSPARIVLAKPGLDGHTMGIRAVARALRDAGFEVIYLGMMITAAEIVAAADAEDADVIGVSLHNGTHMTHVPEILQLVKERRLDCAVVLGGIAPEGDVRELMQMGLDAFFGPGTDSMTFSAEVLTLAQRRFPTQEPS